MMLKHKRKVKPVIFPGLYVLGAVFRIKNTSTFDQILLSDIKCFPDEYWQDNNRIAKKFGVCRKTVFNSIERLKALDLITYTSKNKNQRILRLSDKSLAIFENASYVKTEPVKQTKESKSYAENSEEYRLAELLLDLILERKSDFREGQTERKGKTLQSWARYIDLMILKDQRTPSRIDQVIRWCQSDNGNGSWRGWRDNILSTKKLREKFDRLELCMRERNGDNSQISDSVESSTEYLR